MFDPSATPRLFGVPLGVDFCTALIEGIEARLQGQPPEALAKVELFVNTGRTQRRLRSLYHARGAGFLPRIRLVTDLAEQVFTDPLPPAIAPLKLRLQLARLVSALLDQSPELAPRAALYGLSDSLADLMAEMHEEGVTPAQIATLDVGEHATHWQRAQAFLSIVAPYFTPTSSAMTVEARQARAVDRLVANWAVTPPAHPIIVAGSTGSRRPTAELMQAVARLPQGAVVLPGLDTDLPRAVWDSFRDNPQGEDHPQFRFYRLAKALGLHASDLPRWSAGKPAAPSRNRLISLALRPAPVTSQWLSEGPALDGMESATEGLTLIEAPSPQIEASTIALRLREAAQDGIRAALISPDPGLTRQVTAALDRWGIEPDDSTGQPLSHSAPGRFLRHVAEARATRLTGEALLVVLKHPLCHSAREDRGEHLRRTRDLELEHLRGGQAFPSADDILLWASKRETDPGAVAWARWLGATLLASFAPEDQPLSAHVDHHLHLAHQLAAGPEAEGSGALWQRNEGAETEALMGKLAEHSEEGGRFTGAEYRDFLTAILAEGEARDPLSPHPQIMIWGTMEARVQGADLVILAGLNEGSWPGAIGAEPWLNRAMRAEAGLRLPERVIGLAAHDFQQSVAGHEVWLSRAKRDAETETVPSRWLNRLTNLMRGANPDSAAALEAMRARGRDWVARASVLDLPEGPPTPAYRPAPAPVVEERPRSLSVTQIEKLIRDPYAIYASKVLRLRKLRPLRQDPDAPLRGTVLHDALHSFVLETRQALPEDAETALMRAVDDALLAQAPWPATRLLWRIRMNKIAPWFIETERQRRAHGSPYLLETKGSIALTPEVTLSGTADRMDLSHDGKVLIYDYKTGSVPTKAQEAHFNKQLWLEAVMVEKGGFGEPRPVEQIAYIGLGSGGKLQTHPVSEEELGAVEAGVLRLVEHYRLENIGFTARRAMEKISFDGDYDHLARFGEWDTTQAPTIIKLRQAK